MVERIRVMWTYKECIYKMFFKKRCPICSERLKHRWVKRHVGETNGFGRIDNLETDQLFDVYKCKNCNQEYEIGELANWEKNNETGKTEVGLIRVLLWTIAFACIILIMLDITDVVSIKEIYFNGFKDGMPQISQLIEKFKNIFKFVFWVVTMYIGAAIMKRINPKYKRIGCIIVSTIIVLLWIISGECF